ncbi:MAG: hypothetical protein ACOYNL_05615 [Rickettsiales bacterium]
MATIEKRISDAGAVTFRVKVRVKGVPTQNATFQRLTDAKDCTMLKQKRHALLDFCEKFSVMILIARIRYASFSSC